MTEAKRTPQQMISRDVPAEVEVYKAELKHLVDIGHLGDGLLNFYDSLDGLADQIQKDAEEIRLLLIDQSNSVRHEIDKFRHIQDHVDDLLRDYSQKGPMAEARDAIILEGLALFQITM